MKKLITLLASIFVLAIAIVALPDRTLTTFATEGIACERGCPTVHFEWSVTVYDDCPEGFEPKGKDKCEKGSGSNKVTIDRPSHQEVKTADVLYEKSEDPNKCHRPSDSDLKDVYGMDNDAKNDFKDQNPEFMDSTIIVPDGYYEDEGYCYPKEEVCTDDSATNYGGADGRYDTDKEVSNNQLCQYPETTPTPTQTPTSTPTPTPTNGGGTGGPSDGLGCAVNDCSQQQKQPTQAVLGLSSTGSGANIYLNLAQLLSALTLASAGFKLFRKHA